MSVGGKGVPRLQELAYLETAHKAAAAGLPFEEIRLALVDHIWALRRAAVGDPPDPADFQAWRLDQKKYVSNVTDALKELMRLGFIDKAILPSSGQSAYAHATRTFTPTAAGKAWATLLATDRRAAYDDLLPRLVAAHPGFEQFLTVVGVIGGGQATFVVPLLRWGDLPKPRTNDHYLAAIGPHIAGALASADLGWRCSAAGVEAAVRDYVDRVLARAESRGKDPFPSSRAFTQTCEEALIKLAFGKAGCPLDYISIEIARRWSRWLNLASFSYHVPGPPAARFWSAAEMDTDLKGGVHRRVGDEWRDRVLIELHDYCRASQAAGTTYIPVWEARAATCWKLRIVDDEFDRAVADMIAGRRGEELPWRVHLDQVSVGPVPTSAAPFSLTNRSGATRNYNVITTVPKQQDRKMS